MPMPYLPEELVEDILSRLPVKCLLRLRCVSKSWLTLISSPYFVKLHLNRSVQTKINLSLFMRSYSLYLVDFDSLDGGFTQPAVVDYHPLNGQRYSFQLWGSCDGLICMSNSIDTTVCLWNPSTRKSIQLPYESVEVLHNLSIDSFYGFGYDYTSDDYKVVRIVEFIHLNRNLSDYEVMVYSLSSNSWHRSEKSPHCPNLYRTGNSIAGGAFHWISGLESESESDSDLEEEEEEELENESLIVAFHLGTEKYRVIPQPKYRGPHFLTYLHNFDGCLSLTCFYKSMTADIWLLKDYGGKNEYWSRLITEMPIIRSGLLCLNPIAYSKCREKVLLEVDYYKLVWYNLEQESVEDITVHGIEGLFEVHTCLESLVSVDVTEAALTNANNPQHDENKRERRRRWWTEMMEKQIKRQRV